MHPSFEGRRLRHHALCSCAGAPGGAGRRWVGLALDVGRQRRTVVFSPQPAAETDPGSRDECMHMCAQGGQQERECPATTRHQSHPPPLATTPQAGTCRTMARLALPMGRGPPPRRRSRPRPSPRPLRWAKAGCAPLGRPNQRWRRATSMMLLCPCPPSQQVAECTGEVLTQCCAPLTDAAGTSAEASAASAARTAGAAATPSYDGTTGTEGVTSDDNAYGTSGTGTSNS